MIGCLIGFLIAVLIAVILVYVLEAAVTAFIALPPQVFLLIRLIVGLIVLLYGLQCLGLMAGTGFAWMRPCR